MAISRMPLGSSSASDPVTSRSGPEKLGFVGSDLRTRSANEIDCRTDSGTLIDSFERAALRGEMPPIRDRLLGTNWSAGHRSPIRSAGRNAPEG